MVSRLAAVGFVLDTFVCGCLSRSQLHIGPPGGLGRFVLGDLAAIAIALVTWHLDWNFRASALGEESRRKLFGLCFLANRRLLKALGSVDGSSTSSWGYVSNADSYVRIRTVEY